MTAHRDQPDSPAAHQHRGDRANDPRDPRTRSTRRWGWMGLGILVIAAAAHVWCARPVITWGMYGAPTDEEYYLRYASQVAERGLAVFPRLFRAHLGGGAARASYPPPSRLATILVDALGVRLGGPRFTSLQAVSLASFLFGLVLVFASARQATDELSALLTTLLVSVSPLWLAMAGRALADSLVATLLAACLWLCLRALIDSRARPRRWSLVATLYCVAFLAKELSIVLIPLSLLLMGWFALRCRRPWTWWSVAAVSVVPALAAAAIGAWAAGDILLAWRTLHAAMSSPAANPYAIAFGRGPWFRYLVDYLLLSPVPTVFFLFWLGSRVRDRGHPHGALDAWALIPALFVFCAAPFTKNIRYALVLELPIRLGAVCWMKQCLEARVGTRWTSKALIALTGLLAWLDLQAFARLFVFGGIADPVSVELLARNHFLPGG